MFHRGRDRLGETDDRDERGYEQAGADGGNPVGRWRRMCALVAVERKEIIAMAHGLDEHKGAVEHQGDHAGEDELRIAEARSRRADENVRHHQRENREAASTANAALAPCSWNPCSPCRAPPHSRQPPTTPLHTIMTAAKTVSRASPALPSGVAIMTVTISATSITVTATASTSVPNGSPRRWATTSAW